MVFYVTYFFFIIFLWVMMLLAGMKIMEWLIVSHGPIIDILGTILLAVFVSARLRDGRFSFTSFAFALAIIGVVNFFLHMNDETVCAARFASKLLLAMMAVVLFCMMATFLVQLFIKDVGFLSDKTLYIIAYIVGGIYSFLTSVDDIPMVRSSIFMSFLSSLVFGVGAITPLLIFQELMTSAHLALEIAIFAVVFIAAFVISRRDARTAFRPWNDDSKKDSNSKKH